MEPNHYKAFLETLSLSHPPKGWPPGLQSLWYDAKGNWEASHDIAQEMHTRLGCWIHAYLHRKEGDSFNADYWYRKADKQFSDKSLAREHREIVETILNRQGN